MTVLLEDRVPEKGQLWRHYKGGLYEVLGVGQHAETKESGLVFLRNTEHGSLSARPMALFDDMVEVPEGKVLRFELEGLAVDRAEAERFHWQQRTVIARKERDTLKEQVDLERESLRSILQKGLNIAVSGERLEYLDRLVRIGPEEAVAKAFREGAILCQVVVDSRIMQRAIREALENIEAKL